jgi:hypothetical protein
MMRSYQGRFDEVKAGKQLATPVYQLYCSNEPRIPP